MKPSFRVLIALTLLSALLLLPFAVSDLYLATLRDHGFERFRVYEFLRGDLYKQATGFTALLFVLLEMGLTLRKRGLRWKIRLPKSMIFWRVLHIFLGVGLLGVVLIHTVGATGLNFNAVFLWVFFGVTLSALVGVVAETGVLESGLRKFQLIPKAFGPLAKLSPVVGKGALIRDMRGIWLSTHIFLVCLFFIMLGFHIFFAYYYQ
ncbi:MAG: hypothetical protein AAGF24_15675 [Cyanobacteria bacterium P01_H01_bin.121]